VNDWNGASDNPEPLQTFSPTGAALARTPSSRTASSSFHTSSRTNSIASRQTNATSLAPLQVRGNGDSDGLEPLNEEELDAGSFDLIAPISSSHRRYCLEERSEQLFSREHLQVIFADPTLLDSFIIFIRLFMPSSTPLLYFYLDALKAWNAIQYSNAIVKELLPIDGHGFTQNPASLAANVALKAQIDAAFDALTRQELPAFVTHTWIRIASVSIRKRITGTLPIHLRQMSEGLAEVFCLTDPSRHDNPIVFASDGM